MILIQFIPILFGLSVGIPIFFFGEWEYGLIVGALIWTIGGTVFLIVLGLILRLVGIEYDLQKQEAAYRKILVIAEDDGNVCLLYTSPSPRDRSLSRMPSSA